MLLALALAGQAQVGEEFRNNIWVSGYDQSFGPGIELNYLNFKTSQVGYFLSNSQNEYRYHSSTCDYQGNTELSFNGRGVDNGTYSPMSNGQGFTVGPITNDDYSSIVFQGSLSLGFDFLIKKNYFIYQEYDVVNSYIIPLGLRYSVADMNQNGGQGAVILRDQLLLQDSLVGRMQACRHANGRDWWLIVPRWGYRHYYTFLVQPDTILAMPVQYFPQLEYIDENRIAQSNMSPDGRYFGMHRRCYQGENNGIDLFSFDRCDGTLTHLERFMMDAGQPLSHGLVFSPDASKLYLHSNIEMFQYDMNAIDISGSGQLVGVYDGFIDFNFGIFAHSNYAPNGKIYITSNYNRFWHTIHNPNARGLACDFRQHDLNFFFHSGGILPHNPEYKLGPVDGSVCDTLGLDQYLEAVAVVSPALLDFGEIDSGQLASLPFHIYNQGEYTLYVNEFLHHDTNWVNLDRDTFRLVSGSDSSLVNLQFRALQPGVYRDTVDIYTSVGAVQVIVQANVRQFNGTNTQNPVSHIVLYPNPATDAFQLLGPASLQGGQLDMLDAQGRLVHRQRLDGTTGAWQISTQHLPAGLYLVNCRDVEGIQYSSKIMVND
jgi:hypothetical protein